MSISRLIRTGLAGLAVLASTPLMADQLPIPVDAKVVGQTSAQELEQEQERVYPLGSLRKISNVVRMEGKVEGRGKVSYATYQLPAERSANEAFTAAREALQTAGGYPLFWCQGQDCGESSLWSAQLAGRFNLTGADNQQAFILLRRSGASSDTLVALYSITKGNRRAYLHVEEFVANAPLGEVLPTPATVQRELLSTGKLDYADLKGEPQPAWVNLLSRSLNLNSTLRVTLTGAQAEAWREQLVKAGVRAARLEVGRQPAAGLHVELIR